MLYYIEQNALSSAIESFKTKLAQFNNETVEIANNNQNVSQNNLVDNNSVELYNLIDNKFENNTKLVEEMNNYYSLIWLSDKKGRKVNSVAKKEHQSKLIFNNIAYEKSALMWI